MDSATTIRDLIESAVTNEEDRKYFLAQYDSKKTLNEIAAAAGNSRASLISSKKSTSGVDELIWASSVVELCNQQVNFARVVLQRRKLKNDWRRCEPFL